MLLTFPALAQQQRRAEPPLEPDEVEESRPEYTFNPLQAAKEMQVGDFYFKKKSYKAAAGRYEEAARWQPDLAEAHYKLGECREKLEQFEAAVAAYQKYLELTPDARDARKIRKRISALEAKLKSQAARR